MTNGCARPFLHHESPLARLPILTSAAGHKQAEQQEADTWRHWDRKLLHRRFVDEPETPPEHGDDDEEEQDEMEVTPGHPAPSVRTPTHTQQW